MEIAFSAELEQQLRRRAAETGEGTERMVARLLAELLEHEAWFARSVAEGLASLDRNESQEHAEVVARVAELLRR